MKSKIMIFVLLIINLIAFSSIINFEYKFEQPQLSYLEDYNIVNFENTKQLGNIGEPSLPYLGVKLLIPQGEKAVSINVRKYDRIKIADNITLAPMQPQIPLSANEIPDFTEPNSAIYSQNSIYPEKCYNALSTHYLSGFSIGFTAITPIEYNPFTKEIWYYQKLEIEIISEQDFAALEATKFLHDDDFIVNFVANNVNNPQQMNSYNLTQDRDDEIDYLIIAEQSKVDNWQELKNVYQNRGLITEIFTIEDIQSEQTGNDLQEKIRNFLIEQYTNSSIQYVLLAGDTNVIPHRGLYGTVNGGSTVDYNIPADMYYSCLDGNWNNDMDDRWGEPDEADLAPEFAISRFCYNNDQEINNFITKVDGYLNSPVQDELTTSLFVGEYLWAGPTWGGDYMDEMIGGSSTNGHETVGVPTGWNISTLYERDGNWNTYDILAEMSNGPNLINHLGHSSTDYNMKLYSYQVNDNNITNDGINENYSIIFTQGCYAGAFDANDCITENFVSIANSSVSMISHSRYGWGMQGSTDGASQFFHREFIDALFGEEIFTLGYALNDAKIDAIPFMSGNNTVMYWVCYETNIIGDAGLTVWTDTPQDMIVTHPQDIFIGSTQIEVSSNILGADVVVLLDNEIIGISNTGISGNTTVVFSEPVQETTDISINVLRQNYNTYTGLISVIPAEGAYVVCDEVSFNEDGDYIDGSIQSLDILGLDVTLTNIGMEITGNSVTASLSSVSEFVTILDDYTETTQIEEEESILIEDAFQIELLAGIEDNTTIVFEVDIVSDENQWQSEILLNVQGAILEFDNYLMNVLEGDDQIVNPGESVEIYLQYNNAGSGFSYNLITTLFSYDPYVTISGYDLIPVVNPGETAMTISPFQIDISASCPESYNAQIEMLVYDELGNSITDSFIIPIGITEHDFEDGIGLWEHSSLSAGYSDQWHLSDFRNHTEDGDQSMKCGGAGGSDYGNHNHSGLVTPQIVLTSDAYIRFYHWMDAETENWTQAWDGGCIEISVNGGEFQGIEPVGGYPYTIVPNDESPFDPGIPVFSGNINWEEVELDLSDFSGLIQLRFVFGSDGYVTEEGWYIDDLVLGDYTSSEEVNLMPTKAELKQNYPNPFVLSGNSRHIGTTISYSIPNNDHVELKIFNTKGQLVKTLENSIKAAGNHEISWNGTDKHNKTVATGVYFYKIRTRDTRFSSVKKILILK